MKHYTAQEVQRRVREIWNDGMSRHGTPRIDVTVASHRVDIHLSSLYEPAGLSYRHLKALAEFFGTDNINDDDQFSDGGCGTCDYGSRYGFTLTVRPMISNTKERG